jgi:hypothetical protein
LTGLAKAAALGGDAVVAARLLGVVATIRETHGLPEADAELGPEVEAATRAALGEVSFATAWDAGHRTEPAAAIAEALAATG